MFFTPGRFKEANVQAEFYHQCVNNGINCYLEYRSAWNGLSGCRFDAVIHNHVEILAIVECKSIANSYRRKLRKQNWLSSSQYKKYSKFGVPIYLITCVEEIPEVINILKGRL